MPKLTLLAARLHHGFGASQPLRQPGGTLRPMDWQTNPLLREETNGPRRMPRKLPPQYTWTRSAGVMVLAWKGHTVGTIQVDGRYWLRWRRREHVGTAASPAQAMRFMARWVHARRHLAPLLDEDLPPTTLVPLQDFLREYDAFG